MENTILNFNNQTALTDFISFFSAEIMCIIGIILNLFFFLFFKRKLNIKRVSDFITSGALILNLAILGAICFKHFFFNQDYTVCFFNNILVLNKSNMLTKISLNFLLMLFLFTHYKFNRKVKFKTPILNSIILMLSIMGGFLTLASNTLLIFILLDISVFLIYKYASNARIRKYFAYCPDFITISLSSSFLFYSFYILTIFTKNDLQLNIINICIILSVLLKIGLFPFYNYQTDRNYKTNLPYCTLLFAYLPYLGICAFNKMAQFQNLSYNIVYISAILFVLFSIVVFSIFALKQKNLIKFFANTNCIFSLIIMLNIILFNSSDFNLKAGFECAIVFLSLFSLLSILKLNLNINKINLNSVTTIFFRNKFYALILSIVILFMSSVIYNDLTKSLLSILKNIYLYDIMGYIPAIIIIFALMAILLNSLKIIQNIYKFDKTLIKDEFKKRTTINYVVPVFTILFLVVKIFL